MKLSRARWGIILLTASIAASAVVASSATRVDAAGAYAAPTVVAKGTAAAVGKLAGPLNQPVVDVAADPSGNGYWMVASDGGVFSFGHATFRGSTGAIRLFQPIVAMMATPSGKGYWLIASDGGVFSFGDAHFYGSLGAIRLQAPIVSAAPTPNGKGYWLVASDGGVFAFGNARFHGSAAGIWKNGSVVDIASTSDGAGYVVLVSDGNVIRFGNAPALGNPTHGAAAVAIVRSPKSGYWIVGRDGRIFSVNGAKYSGSANTTAITALGLASTTSGNGYWIVTTPPGPPAPANSGSGRRIVYSISQQRVWTVESNNAVSHFWKVSGRLGSPPVGTYAIQSRSPMSSAGSLRLPYMQRFYKARSGKWIGFHGIPLRPNGTPIQTDSQLGTPLSHGCVRMNQTEVKTLWDWAPLGTTVVVLP
jgi:lipoprotein-anchoring transpeptidase ErfK/SrfK